MSKKRQVAVIAALLAVHLAVSTLVSLVGAPGALTPNRLPLLFLACLAWPMSQASLVAIWASISRMRSYVRFSLALLGLVCAWLVLVAVVPRELPDPECASYAAMFIAQALVILLVVAAGRLAWRQIAWHWGGLGEDHARRLQYDLATLLLWTLCLAATLGLGRLVVGILGGLEPLLLEWIFGSTGGIALAQFLLIAASQAIYLYATLIPLRLAGCFGMTPSRTEANPPTSPESGNPFAT